MKSCFETELQTTNALPSMPEVNEEFFKSSNVIDSLGMY